MAQQSYTSGILHCGGSGEQMLCAAVIQRAILDIAEEGVRAERRKDAIGFLQTPRCYGWIRVAFPTSDVRIIQRRIWDVITDGDT